MKKKSYYQRFMAMTDAQRDAEVAQFDKEDLAPGKPLTAAQRKQWESARRRGRPVKPAAERAARVLVTIPPGLLKKADAYANSHGLSRAALFALGIQRVIAA